MAAALKHVAFTWWCLLLNHPQSVKLNQNYYQTYMCPVSELSAAQGWNICIVSTEMMLECDSYHHIIMVPCLNHFTSLETSLPCLTDLVLFIAQLFSLFTVYLFLLRFYFRKLFWNSLCGWLLCFSANYLNQTQRAACVKKGYKEHGKPSISGSLVFHTLANMMATSNFIFVLTLISYTLYAQTLCGVVIQFH